MGKRCLILFCLFLFSLATLGAAREGDLGELRSVELLKINVAPDVTCPSPSPDGKWLAFAGSGYEGLYLLDLENGSVRQVSDAAGAGFHPAWSESGRSIAFRASTGGQNPKQRILVAHPDGIVETASRLCSSLSLPAWRGEELLFFDFDGGKPREHSLGPKGDRGGQNPARPVATPDGKLFSRVSGGERATEMGGGDKVYFLPTLSCSGELFVVECLDGHIYLGKTAGGGLEDLGEGSYPSFVRDDSAILYEKSTDDGHELTGGDIFLLDLKSRKVRALTATKDKIERRPAMSADGHILYFEEAGQIFKGRVP